ncbi:MAG TPA: hypothetical protein DG754_10800 [Bacteroidales bacterium]|nr:hypothetical protein [Bacteroidales bacterium]
MNLIISALVNKFNKNITFSIRIRRRKIAIPSILLFCSFVSPQKTKYMDKSIHIFGTSVFVQLFSLINSKNISKNTQRHKPDRYIKEFKIKEHLISMLF